MLKIKTTLRLTEVFRGYQHYRQDECYVLINTLWQVGAFVSPYRFGLAKDATGGFKLGLIGSAVVAGVEALPILYVRFRIASNRQVRERTAARPVTLASAP